MPCCRRAIRTIRSTTRAWVDGDEIYGDGVVNDKGPMAAFLVAGKAIREAGYPLKGDLIVSAVAGEISREPIDEWQGPAYLSKDLGARFMITHGAVADFALVAEGTGFGIVGIEPGQGPFQGHGRDRHASLLHALPARARRASRTPPTRSSAPEPSSPPSRRGRTTTSNARPTAASTARSCPKASINAIRSGYPYNLTSAPQVCQFFVDTRILPGANPLDLRDELRGVLRGRRRRRAPSSSSSTGRASRRSAPSG